jgi:hypothetical protein
VLRLVNKRSSSWILVVEEERKGAAAVETKIHRSPKLLLWEVECVAGDEHHQTIIGVNFLRHMVSCEPHAI